ncbi:MAG: hypothetical protein ACFFG0_07945 [Candidatus Thorarchaeota archaeon]
MARPKNLEREAIKVNLNIDREIDARLEELSKFEGVTKSNFVEMLVTRWDEGINPESKLNNLIKSKEKLMVDVNKIENEIKEVGGHIMIFNKIKREKASRKPEAIQILKNLFLKGEYEQAEKVAKFWQIKTGISALTLLMEAKEHIDEGQQRLIERD